MNLNISSIALNFSDFKSVLLTKLFFTFSYILQRYPLYLNIKKDNFGW